MDIVRLKNAVTDRDHALGPSDAPVTLIEYGNFECIHCRAAYPLIKEVQKVLRENLRFVFRHFPTVKTHPHSLRAAEASEAAAAQGKFWEMHDQMFTHQQVLDDTQLLRCAKRIGLDMERFSREMSENTFLNLIEADYQRSIFDEHVTGTPTFYINAARYTGATNVKELLEAIKAADTEDQIRLPATTRGLRGLLARMRKRSNGL